MSSLDSPPSESDGARSDPPDGLPGRLRDVWLTAARQREPLPSELALAELLGVSRPRVREALIRLEAEGLVRRRVGSGTFPNVSALAMPVRIDQSYEFTDMLREAGFAPKVEVLSAGWCELSAAEAADLDLPAGAPAYTTTKRWTADGEPVMTAVDLVPVRRRLPEPDPAASVFELVAALRGEAVEWESAWVQARLATAVDADLLGVPVGAAVLGLTLVGVSRQGQYLYRAQESHRQGTVPYGMIRTVRR